MIPLATDFTASELDCSQQLRAPYLVSRSQFSLVSFASRTVNDTNVCCTTLDTAVLLLAKFLVALYVIMSTCQVYERTTRY